MKYLILLILCSNCSNTSQSYSSKEYKNKCDNDCLKDYGTYVDWIGQIDGKCYCK